MTNTSVTVLLPEREPLYQKSISDMQPNMRLKTFIFDRCFWCVDQSSATQYASQETIFDEVGSQVITDIFSGFNSSVFAYGQTGSGKSYRYE